MTAGGEVQIQLTVGVIRTPESALQHFDEEMTEVYRVLVLLQERIGALHREGEALKGALQRLMIENP